MRNRSINKRIYDYLNLIIFYNLFSDDFGKFYELEHIIDELKSKMNINIEYYKKSIERKNTGINLCRVLKIYKKVYKIRTKYPEIEIISYRYIGSPFDVEIKINILESLVIYLNNKLNLVKAHYESDLLIEQGFFILKNHNKFKEFVTKYFD